MTAIGVWPLGTAIVDPAGKVNVAFEIGHSAQLISGCTELAARFEIGERAGAARAARGRAASAMRAEKTMMVMT